MEIVSKFLFTVCFQEDKFSEEALKNYQLVVLLKDQSFNFLVPSFTSENLRRIIERCHHYLTLDPTNFISHYCHLKILIYVEVDPLQNQTLLQYIQNFKTPPTQAEIIQAPYRNACRHICLKYFDYQLRKLIDSSNRVGAWSEAQNQAFSEFKNLVLGVFPEELAKYG